MPPVSSCSNIDSGETVLKRPSASKYSREEWKERVHPFQQSARMFEGVIRCYFYEELEELKGDADEIEINTLSYKAGEGIEIGYTRYWY